MINDLRQNPNLLTDHFLLNKYGRNTNPNKHTDDLFIECANYFHHDGQKAKNFRPYIYSKCRHVETLYSLRLLNDTTLTHFYCFIGS